MNTTPIAVALEKRLRRCRNVLTLGVRPNFSDYGPEDVQRILAAPRIYYPSAFYAGLFDALGKPTFPSYHNYKCAQDKIRQSTLFEMAGIPHPKTRFFYGKRQKGRIGEFFDFPLVGKIPRGSSMGRGVFLLRDKSALDAYCERTHVAYIQEYLPIDRDIRVVVIGRKAVHAYWRIAPPGSFYTNISAGGRVGEDAVPPAAVELAERTARCCGWDDVGLDICRVHGEYYVLEGNMKYGKQGFAHFGMDYDRLMEKMIEDGRI